MEGVCAKAVITVGIFSRNLKVIAVLRFQILVTVYGENVGHIEVHEQLFKRRSTETARIRCAETPAVELIHHANFS